MMSIPVSITIPTPTPMPRGRGIHSTGRFGDIKRFRCNMDDVRIIAQASQLLGLTESEFMRWCSTQVAKKLMETEDG